MYSDDPSHVGYYRDWMKLGDSASPTFADNLGFLFSYQTGFMYMRYFAWNFVGRQNDEQGHGNLTDGNWLTGIKAPCGLTVFLYRNGHCALSEPNSIATT